MASKWSKEYILAHKKILIYTGLILITHIAYGIVSNIIGATTVDLSYIYGIPVETALYFPIASEGGYLLGSLIGFLYRWLNRQLAMVFLIALMGLTSTLMPYYSTIAVAMPVLFLSGLGSGAWDASSGFWMVEMWPVGNSAILQFLHCMYGLGTVLAPLIAAPFVWGDKTPENGRNITVDERIRSLTIPFAAGGLSLIAIPLTMLLLFFFFRYRRPSELPPSETTSPDEKSPEEREAEIAAIPHRVAKLALCGVCLAAYSSVELGWFNFSTTMWQFLPVDLDATQSNLMMSIVSGTFTLGRFLTGFIALRLSPDTILAYHLVTMAVGLGTLFLGRADQTFIIIGNALFGFGLSAMWPALFAFTERHLRLSDRVCSLYSFLAGFLSIMTPLILGSTFNAHPTALFLIEGINLTICAAAFITVKLWIERDNAIAKRNAKAEVSSHKVL